jgi:hypothetical protein
MFGDERVEDSRSTKLEKVSECLLYITATPGKPVIDEVNGPKRRWRRKAANVRSGEEWSTVQAIQ